MSLFDIFKDKPESKRFMISWYESMSFNDYDDLKAREQLMSDTCSRIGISGDNVAEYKCFDVFSADNIHKAKEHADEYHVEAFEVYRKIFDDRDVK